MCFALGDEGSYSTLFRCSLENERLYLRGDCPCFNLDDIGEEALEDELRRLITFHSS